MSEMAEARRAPIKLLLSLWVLLSLINRTAGQQQQQPQVNASTLAPPAGNPPTSTVKPNYL